MYERNNDLKKKVKTLSDGIQYYRSIETTLQQALILAEKTAKETKDAAILKAEAIEKEANIKADEIISNAEKEYTNLKQQCVHLVQQFNQYKLQLKQAASAQIELVESDTFEIYSPELNSLYKEETKSIERSEDIIDSDEENKSLSNLSEPMKEEPSSPTIKEVEPAVVLEPIKGIPSEPLEAKVIEVTTATSEESSSVDKSVDNTTEATSSVPVKKEASPHTLDSLLKDLNMSSKKDKNSSDNDPFDFLGSIEDF